MLLDVLKTELETEVWDCLSQVTDPELDEPITDMGFVEAVEVGDASRVRVEFRLPTYWCSPNFAFMMALGIRKEISALRWVRQTEVILKDHCFGDEVNEGVNSGRAYESVFAQYCDGADLTEVTETFLAKAFDRRQETVLLALRKQGKSPDDIVAMTLHELQGITFPEQDDARQAKRYLDLLLSRKLAAQSDDLVFPTWEGKALRVEEFSKHLARLRTTRINMEFNGALCRGLAKTRYKEVEIGPEGPTLIDFIAGRVPPRTGSESNI